MQHGNKTVNYSVYAEIDGNEKYINDTTSLQLPSFEMMSDSIKGAGIMGEIEWPSYLGIGSAVFTPNLRVDGKDAAYLFAPGKKRFVVRWVTDKFDTNNVQIGTVSHKAIIVGVSKKYDPGKVEPGATSDGSNDFETLYYKKFEDGAEVIEIDKLNYIFRINGIDYAESIRNSL